jgi:hypothetical protein
VFPDGIDFVVHCIAFSDKDELTGRYLETSEANFTKSLLISCRGGIGDVAMADDMRVQLARQRLDALLQRLALVGERQFRPVRGSATGDNPRLRKPPAQGRPSRGARAAEAKVTHVGTEAGRAARGQARAGVG